MIIVTGTKRAGTSLWMQILGAAGFPVVGEAFPGVWEASIREANPRGFFESAYRQGIYYRTNPDPETGRFFHPREVKGHAVKIFVPGLVRTDLAYIGPVVGTMRSWREYTPSLKRLFQLEDRWRAEAVARGEAPPVGTFPTEETLNRVRAGQTPAALEWFFDNYDLIRDALTRKYPFHMTTYDRLLADPQGEIAQVLRWLGQGDEAAAVAAVDPTLRTQAGGGEVDETVADVAGIFDELYHSVNVEKTLTRGFIEELNRTNRLLSDRWKEIVEARRKASFTPPAC